MGQLRPIELLERGVIWARRGRILLALLPDTIGDRQAQMLRNQLNWPADDLELVRVKNSAGPGNVLMVEVESESVHEVFTSFGARDVPSGKVVGGVIDQVREYLASSAPVGEYLADQLMIPLALAGGGSNRAIKATLHARTNAEIIARFLPVRLNFVEPTDGSVQICIGS